MQKVPANLARAKPCTLETAWLAAGSKDLAQKTQLLMSSPPPCTLLHHCLQDFRGESEQNAAGCLLLAGCGRCARSAWPEFTLAGRGPAANSSCPVQSFAIGTNTPGLPSSCGDLALLLHTYRQAGRQRGRERERERDTDIHPSSHAPCGRACAHMHACVLPYESPPLAFGRNFHRESRNPLRFKRLHHV